MYNNKKHIISLRLGFTLIEMIVTIAIISILFSLLMTGVQKVRAAAAKVQCVNNMKQLGLATENYVSQRGRYPTGSDERLFPWHFYLLPYLDHTAIAESLERDEKAGLPISQFSAAKTIVRDFICPSDSFSQNYKTAGTLTYVETNYIGIWGVSRYYPVNIYSLNDVGNGMFYLNSKIKKSDITDGISNTIMISERPVPSIQLDSITNLLIGRWYSASTRNVYLGIENGLLNDPILYPNQCHYYFKMGSQNDNCSTGHFWSLHSGGANFVFSDGSVRFLTYRGQGVMIPLATRAGDDIFIE